MSKNGSTKEFILSLIIKNNPNIINPLIEGEFCFRELEKRGMYVDVYGLESKRNLPVFMENQLNVSDPIHYKKVKRIIDSIEEGIVIWIAERFVDKYVNDLYNYLNFEIAKPIDFYAVTINQDYLVQINELNQITQFEAWQYISKGLIDVPVLSPFDSAKIIPKGFKGKGLEGDNDANLVSIKGRNKYLQQRLREKIPFLFNLHRSRKLENRQFIVGAGRTDIEFAISLEDGWGRAFIKLRTTNHQHRELLEEVKTTIKTSTFLSDMSFVFEQNSITHFIDSKLDVKTRIERMAIAFEKMVYVIVPITDRKSA